MTNDAPALLAPSCPMSVKGVATEASRIPRNKLLSHRKFPNGTLLWRATPAAACGGDSGEAGSAPSSLPLEEAPSIAEPPPPPPPAAPGAEPPPASPVSQVELGDDAQRRTDCDAFTRAFMSQNGRVAEGE